MAADDDKPPPYTEKSRAEEQRQIDEGSGKEGLEDSHSLQYSSPGQYGIRNYMGKFYDHGFKDPAVYEDGEDLQLLLNPRPRRASCTSIWWKIFVWIGANFLVFGIIGILVGYLVPQRPIILGAIANRVEIIDRSAIRYNFNLDVCKLVGLILFCIGGITLTIALIFPSFLYTYCDPDDFERTRRYPDDSDCAYSSSFSYTTSKGYGCSSPIDKKVPLEGRLAQVQPERNDTESISAKGKLVTIGEEGVNS